MSSEEFRAFIGTVKISNDTKLKLKTVDFARDEVELPSDYDARTAFPECECIQHVRSQGDCPSCWAFSSSEVLTDRLCIQSKGQIKHTFSPEDLLTCCEDCSDIPIGGNRCGDDSKGGYVDKAFQYAINSGVVSGGDYGSNQGCKPYTEGSFQDKHTTECIKECVNGEDYESSKRYYENSYLVDPSNIEYEIYTNGPVHLSFDMYEDFRSYKSGVYQHVAGKYLNGHAAKAIGFGTEDGVPYWLCANSFGTEWGEEGFFKIRRGNNEVGIESGPIIGATPKL